MGILSDAEGDVEGADEPEKLRWMFWESYFGMKGYRRVRASFLNETNREMFDFRGGR